MEQEEEYDARVRSSEDGEHGARRGVRCKREERTGSMEQEEEYDARVKNSEDGEHGARGGIRCKREEQ
jgi:hypothetical protein